MMRADGRSQGTCMHRVVTGLALGILLVPSAAAATGRPTGPDFALIGDIPGVNGLWDYAIVDHGAAMRSSSIQSGGLPFSQRALGVLSVSLWYAALQIFGWCRRWPQSLAYGLALSIRLQASSTCRQSSMTSWRAPSDFLGCHPYRDRFVAVSGS